MIEFKQKSKGTVNQVPVDKIMEECEEYRNDLIQYCSQYFEYEYEYAEDCVQDAYVALFENLISGVKINDRKSWLYAVVINYKNKAIKDKIKRNEFDFLNSEEKDDIIDYLISYNPDYIDNMTTDKMIEELAFQIVSQLSSTDRELYVSYYWNHKRLKDIAADLNVSHNTIRKRHERLKKKLYKIIKNINFDDF